MDIELSIRNYRCFGDEAATFRLKPGFTAFLGANNSGKSSVLRFLYEFRDLFLRLGRGELETAIRQNAGFNFTGGVPDPNDIFCNANTKNIVIEIRAWVDGSQKRPNASCPAPSMVTLEVQRASANYRATIDVSADFSRTNGIGDGYLLVNGGPVADVDYFMRACTLLSDTLYVPAFRNAINIGTNASYFDIQTGQAFIAAWRQFKSGPVKAQNVAAARLTDDVKRIFGFERLELNPSDDGTTLQLIVDGQSYRLDEQGSGLAHFVVVLANVATRKPAYVLLDEPELGLHPPLQVDFLTVIGSYAREGVLFATHSIGLARSVAERPYSLRRVAEGHSVLKAYEATPELAEFLGELSFSAYRELGFESVLLVEGPTELTTVQSWLRLYQKEHKVVLLSLGGSQMINSATQIHLEELKRITTRVYALIDSERSAENDVLDKQHRAFVENCKKAGVTCLVLKRRATENYFSDQAVKSVKGASYRALAPFQKLNDANPRWDKSENWRIARAMTRAELDATDVGPFLESL